METKKKNTEFITAESVAVASRAVDYIDTLKEHLTPDLRTLADGMVEARRRAREVSFNIASEGEHVEKLETALTEKQREATEFVGGDADSQRLRLQTIKDKSAAMKAEIEAGRELIQTLEKNLPRLQKAADDCAFRLTAALNRYVGSQRDIAARYIDELFLEALKSREAFFIAARSLFDEYGLHFAPSHETTPGKLSLAGWQSLKLTMGYLTMREQSHNAAEQAQLAEQVRRNQQKREADAGQIKPFVKEEPCSTVLTGKVK